jgi:excisionase family DNA binding protein
MLTIAQAAQQLRVSPSTIRREIADGRLAAVRVRRRILVSPAAPPPPRQPLAGQNLCRRRSPR